MGDKEKSLEELKLYLGVEHTLMDVKNGRILEGILERSIKAMDLGATIPEIRKIFYKYVDIQDRSYG